jgi:hypothetical protein
VAERGAAQGDDVDAPRRADREHLAERRGARAGRATTAGSPRLSRSCTCATTP